MTETGATDRLPAAYGRFLKVSAVAVALMLAASAWAFSGLPEDASTNLQMLMAPDAEPQVSKFWALAMMPMMQGVIALMLAGLPFIEPRRWHLISSMKAYAGISYSLTALFLVAHATIIGRLYGAEVMSVHPILIATGILLMVLGNYLGKIQSNWFFGIKTPWTLSSELSWQKTHRIGGRFFLFMGAYLIAAALFLPLQIAMPIFAALMVTGIVAVTVYSWAVWRKDPMKHGPGHRAGGGGR